MGTLGFGGHRATAPDRGAALVRPSRGSRGRVCARPVEHHDRIGAFEFRTDERFEASKGPYR